MAKLCVGVFEKKRTGYVHPLFWVNSNIFDYRAKLKWKHTLHMWNYSLGKIDPLLSVLLALALMFCFETM